MNNHEMGSPLEPLRGVRVWLSGSVPENREASGEDQAAIREFVARFAEIIFRLGGSILHGSHPSLTPILLDKARDHQSRHGRKDCLIMAVSRFWSKHPGTVPLEEWRKTCVVYEMPEAPGASEAEAQSKSLETLRRWMAARSDVFVAVGGKWWMTVPGRAGVPIEFQYAVENGLPSFLLGGLGGAARDYLQSHSHVLGSLRNGLDETTNHALALETSVGSLADKVCDQLCRLPFSHGRVSDGTSFRILALDGGGIKGIFTAAALAAWERQLEMRIVDHFDLIAGTSTGGILALGLGFEKSATEMTKFYRERGLVIFPMMRLTGRFKHEVRHFFRPKHSQEILLEELEKAYYGEKEPLLLKNSKCRLFIPSYHAVAGLSHVFRTPHHPLLTGDANTEIAGVALATAAAPTYFPAARLRNMIAETSYFDGGVWANCPALAAIVEAVCYLEIPLDRLDILSVGTTSEPFTVRKKRGAGILKWGKELIKLLMNAQEETSLKHAKLLAGEPRFLRVDTVVSRGTYSLDSVREIEELADLGQRKASEPEVLGQIRSRFLNGVHANPWNTE